MLPHIYRCSSNGVHGFKPVKIEPTERKQTNSTLKILHPFSAKIGGLSIPVDDLHPVFVTPNQLYQYTIKLFVPQISV